MSIVHRKSDTFRYTNRTQIYCDAQKGHGLSCAVTNNHFPTYPGSRGVQIYTEKRYPVFVITKRRNHACPGISIPINPARYIASWFQYLAVLTECAAGCRLSSSHSVCDDREFGHPFP